MIFIIAQYFCNSFQFFKNRKRLEAVAQLLKECFQFLFALFFLLQQVADVGLQLAHTGVEVYLLIAVAELDVFAGHKAPAFFLYLFESG